MRVWRITLRAQNCQPLLYVIPNGERYGSKICVITHPRICPWFYSLYLFKIPVRHVQTSIDMYEHVRCDQREGMGLLEYLAMPFLHDVAHWRMVVYIYFMTAAGNSIRSQLGSSCQGNWYSTEKACGTARPSSTKSHLPGHSPPAS
jgi:hypothetical protein